MVHTINASDVKGLLKKTEILLMSSSNENNVKQLYCNIHKTYRIKSSLLEEGDYRTRDLDLAVSTYNNIKC